MEYGAIFAWWVLYLLLLFVGTPIVAWILPDTPDRGACVAVPAALGLLTLVSFWVGQVTFGPVSMGIAVLVLLGVSVLAARGGVEVNARAYAETIVVFSVAFAFMVLVRAAAPGIYPGGGEKFLDFGLLQTLLRAEYLPPADMWFAGERVIYYYGGHLIAAVLAKLTGTPGRFAYALALSGFYAMAVTAVYGLASAIAARRDYPRARAAVFAAFLYGFASNLLTPGRVFANLAPPSLREAIASKATSQSGGVYNIKPGEVTIGPDSFSYWTASRIIPGTINEFPLFAYLNGDLHAHMMSVPVMLLGAAVLYGYWRTPAERVWRRRALVFGVLPATTGLLLSVNTWSFPTALGLTTLALALAPASPWSLLPARVRKLDPTSGARGWVAAEAGRVVFGTLVAGVVAVLALGWVAPFVGNVLLAGVGDRHVAFLPDRSPLGPFLIVHGGFLIVFVPYVVNRLGATTSRVAAAVVVAGVLVAVGAATNLVGLALVGPLVVAGWYLIRTEKTGFDGLCLVAGAGLVVIVEFAYLADNASPGRFNTVFKVYAQVWTFWSIAAGVGLAAITAKGDTRLPVSARTRSIAADVFALWLLVSVSLYGAFALTNHFSTAGDLTIDGYEFTREHHPDEAAAIEWLNERDGQPHIVSAPGWKTYTWENPASSLTGLPTVAGWSHERIYRGATAYDRRAKDVKILFETKEARSRAILLDKYDVEYIYVGPREKARYSPGNFADEPGISRAFTGGNVTIYAVNRSALAGES